MGLIEMRGVSEICAHSPGFEVHHSVINRINIYRSCHRGSAQFASFFAQSWWDSRIYRVAHEKPARRLVDQRGRRSWTLYRKLDKCKCKVLTG